MRLEHSGRCDLECFHEAARLRGRMKENEASLMLLIKVKPNIKIVVVVDYFQTGVLPLHIFTTYP